MKSTVTGFVLDLNKHKNGPPQENRPAFKVATRGYWFLAIILLCLAGCGLA